MYPLSPFQEIQINYNMIFCLEAALGNQAGVMMQRYVGTRQVIPQPSFNCFIHSGLSNLMYQDYRQIFNGFKLLFVQQYKFKIRCKYWAVKCFCVMILFTKVSLKYKGYNFVESSEDFG